MSNEGELRELLKDIILDMYGLTPEAPRKEPQVRSVRRVRPGPTFSSGTAPRPSAFARDGSSIPGRKKILVGRSVRLADRGRSRSTSSGSRIPGESDRDFLDRRKRIASAHARGLGAPQGDKISKANWRHEPWEQGH